jgi:hypothetical protein
MTDHARRFEVFSADGTKLIEGTLHTNGIVTSCWVTDVGSVAVFPGRGDQSGLEHFSRISLMPQGTRHPDHAQRTIVWLD